MKVILSETPAKCKHILIDFSNKRIVLTKNELLNKNLSNIGNHEDIILINEVSIFIKDSLKTNWSEIKTIVDAQEFKN